jgi:hypothetical protein
MRPLRSLLVISFACFLVGLAGAQVSASPEVPDAPEAHLSPREQVQRATQYLEEMGRASETVRNALEQARAARDVVKVLCLNDKVNQIDIASRSAKGRVEALGQAVEQNDTVKARHDFAVLQVLGERVDALVAESNQCVGEEVGFFGESEMLVDVDPRIPDPDPDRIGADLGIELDIPVLSSPVL